jgi:quercetin dioxygenase-like cupin family protein
MLRLSWVVFLGFAAHTVAAQDPKPEIENTWVSVLRVHQGPHERAALRDQPPSVVVYLTDVHEMATGPDGQAREVHRKAGETAYLEPARRAEENLSDRPIDAIVIELKPARIHASPVSLDPVQLDPKYHIVDFENDRVRILRTILEPHIKSPMHEHPAYVVVYLTELHTTMKLGDGRVVDNPRRPGEVAWRDPLKHETENIGDHTAVEIQVELK